MSRGEDLIKALGLWYSTRKFFIMAKHGLKKENLITTYA